jgi:hypothetical protein
MHHHFLAIHFFDNGAFQPSNCPHILELKKLSQRTFDGAGISTYWKRTLAIRISAFVFLFFRYLSIFLFISHFCTFDRRGPFTGTPHACPKLTHAPL